MQSNVFSRIAGLVLLFVLALPAVAQRTTGSLKGQVVDPNGAVVVGAKVTATDQDTAVSQSTITTSSGLYIFPTLLPGNYSVKVEGQGFHDTVKKDVPVTANGERVVDVAMTVGSASETVEVVAGAASVETATSTVSNTFSSKEVIDIPTGSQNPLQLAIFAPNTTAQQGGIGGVGGSVGGQRPDTNSFSVDGVDDNNVGVTGNNSNVIQDAVAEFNLVTNQFSAEYANAGAGQFNIVTKTGTNNWHGSAHEYLQNRNLDALDNLTKDALKSGSLDHTPRFDQSIAGGTIGGPLQRDRWFIFGAFQYTDLHQEGNTTTVSVPTAAGQSMLTSLAVDPEAQKLLAVIPTAPKQDQNCASTNDQPCSLLFSDGTQIPYGTAVLFSPNFLKERDFHINSDYRLGKHQIGARYLYNHLTGIQVATTPQTQFNQPETQDARKFSLTDAWAISSNFFNDLRLSYSKYLQQITTDPKFDSYNLIELRDLGGVAIGPSDTQRNLEDNYQILDNQTYARGKHTLKWGAEFRHSIAPTFYLPRSHGDYVYNTTEELVKDVIPGNKGNTLRGAGTAIFSQNQNSIYWFAQDDFKVTPRLTVNLGLRYEFASNFASSKTQAMNALASVPGVIDFHNPKTDKNNYGPRVGFAWDPTGIGKWAVRGGFGVAYGKVFGNLPQLALPPQLQIEENQGLVCGSFNPAPSWCTTGTGFLANGGLPATYTLPSDPNLARGLTQGLIADVRNPKTLNWSLGVQRELYRGGVLEARYLGTRGLRLPVQIRLNSKGAFSAGLTPLPTYFDSSQVPATVTSPVTTLSDFDNYNPRVLGQYGFLSNVTVHEPIGASTYHGGSLLFTQSLRSGLTVRANYTYAHVIDNSTAELFSTFLNPRRPEDAYNVAGDRGNSALDVRQKFALAWTYAVPKVKSESRWIKPLLHGYELNGSFVAQTGQPITVLSPYDANDNFDVAGDRAIINPHGAGRTASDVNAVCNAGPGGTTSIVVLDPTTQTFAGCGAGDDTNVVGYVAIDPKARYVATQLGAKSTAGRNGFLTPGFGVWNLSATKNTHFTESAYLQLRVELFNAFNHRNFTVAGPVTYSPVLAGQNAVSNPNFNLAQPGGAFLNSKLFSGGSRQVQVVMKLIF